MGVNDFVLTCERHNKELSAELDYYRRQNARLKNELNKYKETNKYLENKVEEYKAVIMQIFQKTK